MCYPKITSPLYYKRSDASGNVAIDLILGFDRKTDRLDARFTLFLVNAYPGFVTDYFYRYAPYILNIGRGSGSELAVQRVGLTIGRLGRSLKECVTLVLPQRSSPTRQHPVHRVDRASLYRYCLL